jgi:hypothetical protein
MQAVREYAIAAVDLLRKVRPPEPPVLFPEEKWVRQGDHAYIRQQTERPTWFMNLYRHEKELHTLSEYAKALKLLRADRVIGPQIDKLVGTSTSMMAVQAERLLIGILSESIRKDELAFDDRRFSDAYLATEAEHYAKTVPSVVVGPVVGLAEAPRIRFGDVVLDEMSDDEAQGLLSNGLLQSFRGMEPFAQTSTSYVLRLRYEQPKRIGQIERSEDPFAGIPDSAKAFQEILSVLRLFKPDRVAVPGQVTLSEFFGGRSRQGSLITSSPNIFTPTYKLNPSEGQQLQRLWMRLRDPAVLKRSFVGTAIRRFGYASDRERTEDRLVDLMIAAEGVFLGSNEIDELAYKLSMRFAYFTKVPKTTVRERFEHIKKAYRARSEIVHGDRLKTLKATELGPFTETTGDYVRAALRSMVNEAKKHPDHKPLIDWDTLILGAHESPRKAN